MGFEDTIVNLVIQTFSETFFIDALVIGYSVLFLYFYGSEAWDKITFGERLIFGFIFGVPFALLVLFLSNIVSIIALLLNIPYSFDVGSYLLSGVTIVIFGIIRVDLGEPIHSAAGIQVFHDMLSKRHAFLLFIPLGFAVSFLVVETITTPMLDAYSSYLLYALLYLVIFGTLVVYPAVLATTLVLVSPSRYREMVNLEFEYLFYFKTIEGNLSIFLASRLEPPKRRTFSRMISRRTKVTLLFCVVFLGLYLPVAGNSLALFGPRVASTSFTSFPNTNFITVSSSILNISQPLITIPVIAIYNFTSPTLPIFGISIANPSNFTGGSALAYSDQSLITHETTGDIAVSQLNGTSNLPIGFEVQPTHSGRTNDASLTLRYTNVLQTKSIFISKVQPVNQTTLANGTQLQWYSLSVRNAEPFTLMFSQFYITRVSNANSTFVGHECYETCSTINDFRLDQGTQYLLTDFFVQPKESVTLMVEVRIPS